MWSSRSVRLVQFNVKMKLFLCIIGVASALADNFQLFKNSNDQFTAKMTQEVVKANEGKSIILSAFSVLPPLAQLALASTGASHDELLTAIALPNDEKTKDVFSDLKQQLKMVKGVTLNTASRIYIAKDTKINKKFAALSRDLFNSDVLNLDFGKNVQSSRKINAWVQKQTHNKIKELVRPDDLKLTISVLVNTIYFKGQWLQPFNRNHTAIKNFHVSKSNTVRVPTMQLKHNFKYGESAELDAKLLELPYTSHEVSFLIVLPNEIDGLPNLEKRLKYPSALNKATEEMQYRNNVILSMPKFKIETKTDIGDILKKINVTKIFSPSEAKLDNLLENRSKMYLGAAIQKAFIEVNEEGTEAAAANAFLIFGSSAERIPDTIFKVDRPFYFEIRYKNTALFNGAVVNL